jgi:hypothetical protein
LVISAGESFGRIYRRLLWGRCWRCFVVTAAFGAAFALAGQDAEEAGEKMGWGVGAVYPFLFVVIAATTWRATIRKLGGQPRAAVWASNLLVMVIGTVVIGFGLIFLLSTLLAVGSFRHRAGAIAAHSDSPPISNGVCADIAFSIREEAAKIAVILFDCGVPNEEARQIAMYEVQSGRKWLTDLLPRLNQEQQRMVLHQFQKYEEVGRKSGRDVIVAHLCEVAICRTLQAEKQLSTGDVFDTWRAGVCNRSDEWWKSQLSDLQPDTQTKLNKLRRTLMDAESKKGEGGVSLRISAIRIRNCRSCFLRCTARLLAHLP